MNSKCIILLIGPKGSGKSFIGSILEKYFDLKFIRVEDWAKQIKQDRDIENESYLKQVFEVIENGIQYHLTKNDRIVFESTGLTGYFDQMFESLKKDFRIIIIDVYADSQICLERVRKRDQKIHINISDHQVLMINEKVKARNFKPDFQIYNEIKSEKELVNELGNIVEHIFYQEKK